MIRLGIVHARVRPDWRSDSFAVVADTAECACRCAPGAGLSNGPVRSRPRPFLVRAAPAVLCAEPVDSMHAAPMQVLGPPVLHAGKPIATRFERRSAASTRPASRFPMATSLMPEAV